MVISRVLSRVSILISLVRGLITPLRTAHDHEPPSNLLCPSNPKPGHGL